MLDAVCAAAAEAAVEARVVVRLVCVAVRSHAVDQNVDLVRAAAGYRDAGLTGFDFAGSEMDDPDPRVQAAAFQAARDVGLHTTVHAGDLPNSAPLIWQALELEPDRIAHGVSAIDDPDLCRELSVKGVALDLCPTSNVQSRSVASMEDHPLARLHRCGVHVTLSTDDPTISNVTLTDEYLSAIRVIGLTLPELWAINRGALDVAFAEAGVLHELRATFDEWVAARLLSL